MRFSAARMSLLGSVIAALLVAPAAASAATASVDRACYPGDGSSEIVVTGTGFTRERGGHLMVGGGIVGVTTADAVGQRQHAPSRSPRRRIAGKSKNDQGYEIVARPGRR